jgi:ATP-binding protein involved in chromosome partitioning
MTASVRANQGRGIASQQPIEGVKNIIAIASGKGGVGKSTVSANIACALAQSGARVGLMDADIYGPSIPLIMGVEDAQPTVDEKKELLIPIERYGVKIISMGFLQPGGAAVIWRGPMVAKAVQQFLRDVKWGDIDYLIVDLPPGTGDAQLTLAQAIPLTGAVVVMTPQDLAAAVAVKAVSMFKRLDVPILGIVENMSYFQCPGCNARHHIFSHGGGQQAAEALQVPFFGEVPLATDIGADADQGAPSVVSHPDGPFAQVFREISEKLAAQVSIRARSFTPLAMAGS